MIDLNLNKINILFEKIKKHKILRRQTYSISLINVQNEKKNFMRFFNIYFDQQIYSYNYI